MLNYIHGITLPDYMVNEDASIKSCLQVLQQTNAKFLIVINSDQKFLGLVVEETSAVVLKNTNMSDPIKYVMNKRPHILNEVLNYNKVIEMMHKLEIDIFPVIIADRCHGVFANLPRVISGRTAVLMLGGLGSRLKPYTDKTPKPLLKLSGVSILDHILDKLTKYGFNKIIMCLNYKVSSL